MLCIYKTYVHLKNNCKFLKCRQFCVCPAYKACIHNFDNECHCHSISEISVHMCTQVYTHCTIYITTLQWQRTAVEVRNMRAILPRCTAGTSDISYISLHSIRKHPCWFGITPLLFVMPFLGSNAFSEVMSCKIWLFSQNLIVLVKIWLF